jgi:transposase
MTLKRRQFTKEFKLQVIREIEAGKSVAQAAREHQLHPNTIIKWRKLHQQYAERAFAGNGQTYKAEARIAELERLVGQLALENALLQKALSRLAETRQPQRADGGKQ